MLSHFQLFVMTWAVACQAPLSIGFPRQEYWRELPFLIPRDFPDPGIKPVSSVSPERAGGFFTAEPPGKHAGSNIFHFFHNIACNCPQSYILWSINMNFWSFKCQYLWSRTLTEKIYSLQALMYLLLLLSSHCVQLFLDPMDYSPPGSSVLSYSKFH